MIYESFSWVLFFFFWFGFAVCDLRLSFLINGSWTGAFSLKKATIKVSMKRKLSEKKCFKFSRATYANFQTISTCFPKVFKSFLKRANKSFFRIFKSFGNFSYGFRFVSRFAPKVRFGIRFGNFQKESGIINV